MKTEVKVIADSVSPNFERLTTLQVCFPRFILAEVNTHRVLSRNYRSSRAVPVEKLIAEVEQSPFVPLAFGKNRPGMQANDLLDERQAMRAEDAWRHAAQLAVQQATELKDLGVHKQLANRVLEPFLYVHGVITATEWDNFFRLRCHKDAQPEFQVLATMIREAMDASEPVPREFDLIDDVRVNGFHHESWHLPYVYDHERNNFGLEYLKKMSAARCAWVSYKPFDESDEADHHKVNRTFDKLVGEPMHASPMEHVATPGNTHPANFVGWCQWRHFLEEDRRG
ncbi:thymidylate synthase complementing protein [Stenotrophomonas phage vB_SmaS-AXL_3]|uniref:Thymidylate synthase complementing protein n=1 Tax=Stenotrophomonas phage vB_SmaS-AXL_3 TaxID=2740427 RepID=A0A7D5BFX7_9CAUD|nr:thymidylate synthase [Stenotrophomonas phage vB_SmaS-AXL_3]QKW95580.1 thymidylate synthase complementing protein [Stenotrophomonas phage vB_SmaS-AXL_3]